jgi:hypothetical protein
LVTSIHRPFLLGEFGLSEIKKSKVIEKQQFTPSLIRINLFVRIFFGTIGIVISKSTRIITGYSFWAKKSVKNESESVITFNEYTIGEKFKNFGLDLLRLILSPLMVVAALVCFVYSLADAKGAKVLFVRMSEVLEGNAIERWNYDVAQYRPHESNLQIDKKFIIDPRGMFPDPS